MPANPSTCCDPPSCCDPCDREFTIEIYIAGVSVANRVTNGSGMGGICNWGIDQGGVIGEGYVECTGSDEQSWHLGLAFMIMDGCSAIDLPPLFAECHTETDLTFSFPCVVGPLTHTVTVHVTD
jgi:hypothetical protein